jgi:hypothetical protein
MLKKVPAKQEVKETENWGTWGKEVSEFPWVYDKKEICYILKGAATVTDKQGNTLSFEKGDWVEFEKGLECTWKITEDLEKKYIFE